MSVVGVEMVIESMPSNYVPDGRRAQDEIACFRISETWRKHTAPWFRYIYVSRKRENSNLRDSITSTEWKCQVTFPSYLSQHISAIVRFRVFLLTDLQLFVTSTKTQTRGCSLNNNES